MYSNRQQNLDSPDMQRLRNECGAWLKSLREKAGLSQRELATAIGFEYYSFVSQIEAGKGRIPTSHISAWSEAVAHPTRDFAIRLMSYYDPVNYALIFGEVEPVVVQKEPANIVELGRRVAELEKLVRR